MLKRSSPTPNSKMRTSTAKPEGFDSCDITRLRVNECPARRREKGHLATLHNLDGSMTNSFDYKLPCYTPTAALPLSHESCKLSKPDLLH